MAIAKGKYPTFALNPQNGDLAVAALVPASADSGFRNLAIQYKAGTQSSFPSPHIAQGVNGALLMKDEPFALSFGFDGQDSLILAGECKGDSAGVSLYVSFDIGASFRRVTDSADVGITDLSPLP